MLKDHFSKTVILTTKGREDRAEQALSKMRRQGLIESPDDIELVYGIMGSDLPPPAWWRAGGGAWGCLSSHIRILQDAWQLGVPEILILEDDVCWVPEALDILDSSMPYAPDNWGQMYLGGQHRKRPQVVSDFWLAAQSVNRTHAYAVSRKTIPRMLQHIQYAPDYINSPWPRHIDHQLEVAHQRGDWNIIAPNYWIAGQDENHSAINGRHHFKQWWDWYEPSAPGESPFVVIPKDFNYDPHITMLHEGYEEDLKEKVSNSLHRAAVFLAMKTVAQQAWGLRRMPAIRVEDKDMLAVRETCWSSGIVDIEDMTQSKFQEFLKPDTFRFKPLSTTAPEETGTSAEVPEPAVLDDRL